MFCTASESPASEILLTTQHAKNPAEPLWNEEFAVSSWPGLIEFRLWQEGANGRANLLGKAFLDLPVAVGEPYISRIALPVEGAGASLGFRLLVKVSPEDGEFPADDPIPCFGATIDNPRKKALGLEVDPHGTSLYVTGVKAGSVVHTYNKGVSSDFGVTEGCFIVGVNGVTGKPVDLDKALKNSAKVTKAELVVCPPQCFHLAIHVRDKGSLGIVCPKRPLGRSILITNITSGGALDKWSAECPEQAVVVGDRIVSVNGKDGKAADLLKMLSGANKSTRVVLSVLRKANSTNVAKMPYGGWQADDKYQIPEMQEGAFEG